MYSLEDFGDMIADRVRIDAYAEALRRSVKPGCAVADIGSGTGVLSMLACRFGARHVYAIEPLPVAPLIREAARANGFEDRITVYPQRSTEVVLPERVDVIVSDLRGVLPPLESHFADIIDARTRFLAPGGTLVPGCDRMFVAVVSEPSTFERRRRPWLDGVDGVSLISALRYIHHNWQKLRLDEDALLCEPAQWAQLDYPTLAERAVQGQATLEITKAGPAHGLLAWFETELYPGVEFSNRPGAPSAIYGQAFFPWPEELPLQPGDRIEVDLRAMPGGGAYNWAWNTSVRMRDERDTPRNYRQSSFLGTPLSLDVLRKSAEDYAPALSDSGRSALYVLNRFREGANLKTIANELVAMESSRISSFDAALAFVADLSKQYSE